MSTAWQDELALFEASQLLPDQQPNNATSVALQNQIVVKSGAGRLYGFQVFSNKGAGQFIHAFDAEGAVANGALPVFVLPVTATNFVAVNFDLPGRWFFAGIVLANSSTVSSLTLGSADCWFDAQYI